MVRKKPEPGARRITTKAAYAAALEELAQLQRLPLGTPATEGLQTLAEAILDYEERRAHRHNGGRGKG